MYVVYKVCRVFRQEIGLPIQGRSRNRGTDKIRICLKFRFNYDMLIMCILIIENRFKEIQFWKNNTAEQPC